MYNLLSGIPLNIDWRQILLHLLNLVILFLILYFLLYNPVKKFMEKRKKYYEDRDAESNAKLAAATERKAKYDELLGKADEEESAEVLRAATEKAEKIKKNAEDRAMEELSSVIADAAEKKIAKACSVDGFLAENDKNE